MKRSTTDTKHLIVFIFLSFCLYVISSLNAIKALQGQLTDTFTHIAQPVSGSVLKIDRALSFISELQSVRDENQLLKQQIADLQQKLDDSTEFAKQNEWLNSQLSLKKIKYAESSLAQVVRYEYLPSPGYVYVYIGDLTTVKSGYWALSYDYVVGQVVDVLGSYAKVMLITAPETSIPVKVGQSETLGVLKGNLGVDAQVVEVSASADIKVGDEVKLADASSANLGKYRLGKVSSVVGDDASTTKTLKVQIPLDLLSLSYLALSANHV